MADPFDRTEKAAARIFSRWERRYRPL